MTVCLVTKNQRKKGQRILTPEEVGHGEGCERLKDVDNKFAIKVGDHIPKLITFHNIKSSLREIATYELLPKFVAHDVVPKSPVNHIVASDDDFQEPPPTSIVDKGKAKVVPCVLPAKKMQKQIHRPQR
ncbi:hypothetical protein FXO37_11123 [Capsicum annuum]|nr:hypothetical protein FXO37_11123 [Capsicum annuum]